MYQRRSFVVFLRSQHTHRRVTFSTANPVQDLQDASQHSYYDSGLEESETPSSKSSSGPRIGPLTLPEDHYERTTPDGSIGETEHPENGRVNVPRMRTPPPVRRCQAPECGCTILWVAAELGFAGSLRSSSAGPLSDIVNDPLSQVC